MSNNHGRYIRELAARSSLEYPSPVPVMCNNDVHTIGRRRNGSYLCAHPRSERHSMALAIALGANPKDFPPCLQFLQPSMQKTNSLLDFCLIYTAASYQFGIDEYDRRCEIRRWRRNMRPHRIPNLNDIWAHYRNKVTDGLFDALGKCDLPEFGKDWYFWQANRLFLANPTRDKRPYAKSVRYRRRRTTCIYVPVRWLPEVYDRQAAIIDNRLTLDLQGNKALLLTQRDVKTSVFTPAWAYVHQDVFTKTWKFDAWVKPTAAQKKGLI